MKDIEEIEIAAVEYKRYKLLADWNLIKRARKR